MRRAAAVILLAVLGFLLIPVASASAHPLGNFTINHYDGLHFYSDRIEDLAVIDTAEIPTLQAKPSIDTDGNGAVNASERAAYAAARCGALASSLRLAVNNQPAVFAVIDSAFEYRDGAVNLQVARLVCNLSAPVDLGVASSVDFEDSFDSSGVGWHEITANATGVALKGSPVPSVSVSDTLLKYPDETLQSPLNVRTASFAVDPTGTSSYGGGFHVSGTNPVARALNHLNTFFNGLVGREHLTVGVGLLAVLVAAMLGAGHALLPGHGKTIMAAYLVGRRGRMRDVVAIGATVTATHTAGVIIVGLLISASSTFAPTEANKWLGIASGFIVVIVGISLFRSARSDKPQVHSHGLFGGGHVHSHENDARHSDDHDHTPDSHNHDHRHGHGHGSDGHTHTHHPRSAPVLAAGWSGLPMSSANSSTSVLDVPTIGHHPFTFAASPEPETAALTWTTTEVAPAQPKVAPKPYSRAGLIGLGIAGGLVPSPSALVVLLGAIALGRTVFGVLLVFAYGAGLALTLAIAGLLLIPLRNRLDRLANHARIAKAARLLRVLPFITASLVIVVGLGLAARSASIF